MTKKQFIKELEHIAESGSNEIRLGNLFDMVAAHSVREKDKLLKAIRFATYARDTDDAILYEIKKLLTEGGYPDEADD